jgi:hypothetical protein
MLTASSEAITFKRHSQFVKPWSFQIAVDDQPDDDNFDGIRLSLKKHISPYNAVRFNLGLISRDTYRNDNYTWFYADNYTFAIDAGRKFDLEGVNLSMNYLFYPAPQGRFNFFVGVGPHVSIRDINQNMLIFEEDGYPYYDADYMDIDNTGLIGFGVEGMFGVEWFLGPNVSLLAETGFVLENQWYVFDVDYYDRWNHVHSEVEFHNNGTHFHSPQVKLGLGIYF